MNYPDCADCQGALGLDVVGSLHDRICRFRTGPAAWRWDLGAQGAQGPVLELLDRALGAPYVLGDLPEVKVGGDPQQEDLALAQGEGSEPARDSGPVLLAQGDIFGTG